jgi:hypothetical protein
MRGRQGKSNFSVYQLMNAALLKKKRKFSSYKEIQRDRVQSHMWLTASSFMAKYLRISSYIRELFFIYDFSSDPFWISLDMRKVFCSFLTA